MNTPESSTEQLPTEPESSPTNEVPIVIDLIPSKAQIQPRAFWYKVKTGTEDKHVTVIATSSTSAREGLLQQFGKDAFIYYLGGSEIIMQVNGEVIL